MATKTLCLAPGFSSRLDYKWLGGNLFRSPYSRRDVIYNTVPSLANAEQGAARLNSALLASAGRKVVASHSMGTRVRNLWLREYGPESSVDPDDVVFIGTGDPESKFGGGATIEGATAKVLGFTVPIIADYGGPGFPDETPYRTITVARQYEMWAHTPTDITNAKAVANAHAGNSLHTDYSLVRLGDPNNVTYVDPECPNATYVVAPTFPAPSAPWWHSLRGKTEWDKRNRASIDAGYADLPFTVPAPTVVRLSAEFGWCTKTRWFVRMPSNPAFKAF